MMRGARAAALLAVLAAVESLGCARDVHQLPNSEVAVDAFVADTSDTAAFDVARDSDAFAPPDAAPDPRYFTGEWFRPEGLPPQCSGWQARTPSASVSGWVWKACADLSACEEFVAEWVAGVGRKLNFRRPEPVRRIGAQTWLTYTRLYPNFEELEAAIDVVQPLDGAPVFAYGTSLTSASACTSATGVGDAGIAQVLHAGLLPDDHIISWQRWDDLSTRTLVQLTGKQLSITEASTSASVIPQVSSLFLGWTPGILTPFDYATRSVRERPSSGYAPIELARFAPDGVVGVEVGGAAIDFVDPAGNYTRIVQPAAGRRITWLALDRSSAPHTLVWLDATMTAGKYTDLRVRMSPMGKRPEEMVVRELGQLVDSTDRAHVDFVANDGLALFATGTTELTVLRIADGKSAKLATDVAHSTVQPLWVTSGHAVAVVGDGKLPNYRAYASGAVRLVVPSF